MSRPLNLVANPLRLLLLALLLLVALLIGVSVNQPPSHRAGSPSQQTVLVTAPNAESQPVPANTVANQSATTSTTATSPTTTTMVVTGSSQGPASSAPAAAAEPVQAAPAGAPACQVNPSEGRGTPATCSNP